MESTSRLEMDNFNGTNFELWKIGIEDLLVDQNLWVPVSTIEPTNMKYEEWVVLEIKSRILIRFCLANSVAIERFWKKNCNNSL
jgi:hypothetical protein